MIYILYYFIRDCVSQIISWNSFLVMHEYVKYRRLTVVNCGIKLLKPIRLAESVAPRTSIRQMFVSNLGRDTDYLH
jgi:hypothetical protein